MITVSIYVLMCHTVPKLSGTGIMKKKSYFPKLLLHLLYLSLARQNVVCVIKFITRAFCNLDGFNKTS